MATTIEKLRLAFTKLDPSASGRFGEECTRRWFKRHGWQFEEVDQGKKTLSAKLRVFGGKRPDFIVDSRVEDTVTVVDAKFASTDGGKSFAMPDCEIGKYRRLKAFVEEEFSGQTCEVLFAIVPKEFDGNRLVWAELSEFDEGWSTLVRGSSGTAISLEKREGLWFDNEP
jgi:hypothetical protein